ncbi:MAG TPA: DMT family transporter [Bacteroidales bacterium]|nr:DMT family transporter [Bacteroidales bacterium]HOL74890.1 DMT family transporter [Bacteroidales bacterium]
MKFFKISSSYFELHFVVLLFGITGVLGKLISLSALSLVFYRMIIAAVFLFFWLKIKKINLSLTKRTLLISIITGIIMALHWYLFFYAIKISTVSLVLGLLGTGTLFTSLLEPLLLKKKFSFVDLVFALPILIGVLLIYWGEPVHWRGLIIAILSYLLFSIFSVINKKIGFNNDTLVISFWEFISGGIFMFFLTWENNDLSFPNITDSFYLLILAIGCTAYAFSALIRLMKTYSAYLVIMHVNLEPVYAIILSVIIFGESEILSFWFYIGAAIIISSLFFYQIWYSKQEKLR